MGVEILISKDGNRYWSRIGHNGYRTCPTCKSERNIVADCWDDYDFGSGQGQAQFRAECPGCGESEWLGDNGGVLPAVQRDLEADYQRRRL